MAMRRDKHSAVKITILNWNMVKRTIRWKTLPEKESMDTEYDICLNETGINFNILVNGKIYKQEKSDASGKIHFSFNAEKGTEDIFEVRQQE